MNEVRGRAPANRQSRRSAKRSTPWTTRSTARRGQTAGLLADSSEVDLESLIGVPASVLPADEVIAGWDSDLAEKVVTRHMRTNHELAAGAAPNRLRSKLYALTLAPATPPSVLWADNWHTFVRAGGAWLCSAVRIEVVHRGL